MLFLWLQVAVLAFLCSFCSFILFIEFTQCCEQMTVGSHHCFLFTGSRSMCEQMSGFVHIVFTPVHYVCPCSHRCFRWTLVWIRVWTPCEHATLVFTPCERVHTMWTQVWTSTFVFVHIVVHSLVAIQIAKFPCEQRVNTMWISVNFVCSQCNCYQWKGDSKSILEHLTHTGSDLGLQNQKTHPTPRIPGR